MKKVGKFFPRGPFQARSALAPHSLVAQTRRFCFFKMTLFEPNMYINWKLMVFFICDKKYYIFQKKWIFKPLFLVIKKLFILVRLPNQSISIKFNRPLFDILHQQGGG